MFKLALLAGSAALAAADIPAHCLRDTTLGTWTFYEGPDGQPSSVDCTDFTADQAKSSFEIELSDPNVATAADGSVGTWTLVYDQGFEVTIAGKSYWAFFDYSVDGAGDVTSYCGKTSGGWAHEAAQMPTNWSCYAAESAAAEASTNTYTPRSAPSADAVVKPDPEFLAAVKSAAKTWTVAEKSVFEGMPLAEAQAMRGAVQHSLDRTRATHTPGARVPAGLPAAWDWTIDGNIDIPMRDQANCGSCYAFASTTTWNALVRVASNSSDSTIFSPQYLVSCSDYAQGCDGGFPYLMGKEANDHGLYADRWFPYSSGIEPGPVTCDWMNGNVDQSDLLKSITNPQYVGGYYGGCNADAMMQTLVAKGPLAVSFMVEGDFSAYESGVYVPSGVKSEINPFVETNHVVSIVGYGFDDEQQLPYWRVANSWSSKWGEAGYFRIVRGEDALGIESMAVTFDAVV